MRRKKKQQLLSEYTAAIQSVETAEHNVRSAVELTPHDRALELIRRSILHKAENKRAIAQKAWEEC